MRDELLILGWLISDPFKGYLFSFELIEVNGVTFIGLFNFFILTDFALIINSIESQYNLIIW